MPVLCIMCTALFLLVNIVTSVCKSVRIHQGDVNILITTTRKAMPHCFRSNIKSRLGLYVQIHRWNSHMFLKDWAAGGKVSYSLKLIYQSCLTVSLQVPGSFLLVLQISRTAPTHAGQVNRKLDKAHRYERFCVRACDCIFFFFGICCFSFEPLDGECSS